MTDTIPNNRIPKTIHFFWGGAPLRDKELKNLMTFLFHTDDSWTIKIWTECSSYITQSLAKNEIENPRIHVCEYLETANNCIIEMKEMVKDTASREALQTSLETLQRLSVGMKHPAVVKDIFSIMLMYYEGGYYFDLDSYAHQTIKEHNAPRGILMPANLNSICSLASKPKEYFWCDALMLIKQNISGRFFLERTGHFYDFSSLKSKKNHRERRYNSGIVTGELLPRTLNRYEFAYRMKRDHYYRADVCFQLEPTDRPDLPSRKTLMGVTLRVAQDDSSGWRKGKDPEYAFDDLDLPEEVNRRFNIS